MGFKKYILTAIFAFAFSVAAPAQKTLSDSADIAELRKVRESFVNTTLVSYSPSPEVTERFLEYSDRGRASIDVLLMQLYLSVQLPEEEVRRVMDLFDWEKGQWTDIDYTNMQRGEWDMTLHVTRIYALAKSYKWPESHFYMSKDLSRLLHKAAGWWFTAKPKNPNWWHNDIGVPKKLTAAMLLLRDELSPEEVEGALYVLERSKFGRTGQNKFCLAGNQLMKALLIEDPALAREAVRQISEEVYVTEDEGIQPDWSYHQHGPMLQFGNYGLAYAEGMSFWVRVLSGTAYAFSEEQVEILENFILNGLCWTIWRGIMDPSACGRQLVQLRGKAYSCAVAMQNMAALGRPRSHIFQHAALQDLQPELYDNELIGAVYYPRSDFGIYRTPSWYASMRMQSERTIGYEFTNAENLLAQFSADAAQLLLQTGDEYDDIYPYWDWRKLPGVTSYEDGKPLNTSDKRQDKQNNSSHVGGLTSGDEMVTTMEVNRFGLHAFKTSFFFPDCIISLGSDIRRERDDISRITTALDQNHLNGKVKTGKVGKGSASVGWAHHSGRGYVSLDGAPLKVETGLQKGNWKNIAPCYDRPDSGRVFKCYLEHDPKESSSYAYAVLPCTTPRQVKAFASKCAKDGKSGDGSTPKLLCNTPALQAISYRGNIYAVAHRAGTYTLLGKNHSFKAPGIYILTTGGTLTVSQSLPEPANYPLGEPEHTVEITPDEGTTIYGFVSCEGVGVEGVQVSDGYHIAFTDENGVYQLRSEKKNGYVFITVPSGYEVRCEGSQAIFYSHLQQNANISERCDFELFDAGDQTNHTVFLLGDMHLAGNRCNDRAQFSKFTAELNDYVSSHSGEKMYAFTLGDMTWDLYWYKASYDFKEYVADMDAVKNLPVFNTIGNHDHNMKTSVDGNISGWDAVDWDTAKRFRDNLGPNYYSVNIGDVHYVVLDNIYCTNTTGGAKSDRHYSDRVSSDNIAWLKKDLSTVSKSTPVVVMMHATLYNQKGEYTLDNATELVECFSGFADVTFITGHTHKHWSIRSNPSLKEHNSGSVCATWWLTGYSYDRLNISQDGAPGGYRVMDVKGRTHTSYYKGTGRDESYQFRAYDLNEVYMDNPNISSFGGYDTPSTKNEVLINVWDYDTSWKVKVTEDGKELPVTRLEAYDPLYVLVYVCERCPKPLAPGKSLTNKPYCTNHMFTVTASSATSTLNIEVTDDEGRVYTETMVRPRAFSVDTYK